MWLRALALSQRGGPLRMIDAASVLPAATDSIVAYFDAPHSLQTLPDDLVHTFFISGFGLAGAYLTQGAVAYEGFSPTDDDDDDAYRVWNDADADADDLDRRDARPRKKRRQLEASDDWLDGDRPSP